MYLPAVDQATGHLVELRLVPMRIRRLRVSRASREEAEWLRDTINRESRRFQFGVELCEAPRLELRPPAGAGPPQARPR